MGSKNRFNTVYLVFPITQSEIEAQHLPELPNGAKSSGIGGLLFPPSEIERAYYRWQKSENLEHPYDSPLLSSATKALRSVIDQKTDMMNDVQKQLDAAQKQLDASQTEVKKWISKNNHVCRQNSEVNQSLIEAKALKVEAEQEKSVSDSLATARETEKDKAKAQTEELQTTINRYKEKYQGIDRQLTAWQRFGVWLFGI